jgi:hypothetical protein
VWLLVCLSESGHVVLHPLFPFFSLVPNLLFGPLTKSKTASGECHFVSLLICVDFNVFLSGDTMLTHYCFVGVIGGSI